MRERQIKIYAYIVGLFLIAGGGMILTSCGEKGGVNTVALDSAKEGEVSGEEAQTARKDLSEPGHRWEDIEDATEEDQALQETENSAKEEPEEAVDMEKYNEERFYECTDMSEADREEAKRRYQRLCEDNIFQDQTAWLVWAVLEDLDQNGQQDIVVMVKNDEYSDYGEGSIYFYMNEDAPYCFQDENYPFSFGFHVTPGDFDGDGYTEIAFESIGTGVGGAGDWHPRILKYKDHILEPMEFPYEAYDDWYDPDWRGVRITITQETEADTYSAYCAYLDDTIVFEAGHLWEPEERKECGGNSRGYFNLCRREYEGRDALEVSEILYGEGGVSHGLGFAEFLIVWDENGEGEIVKWWVESYEGACFY